MFSACTRRLPFAFALTLALWNASAHACKCRPLSVEEAKADASAIFEGRVTNLADAAPAEGAPPAEKLITLALVRTWKGLENEETITVRTNESSASCGYVFELDKSYLVYAQGTPEALSVTSCGRTRPMAETSEDLAALGAGITPVKIEPVADAGKPAEPPKTKSGGCASSSTQRRASLAWLGLPVLALAARRRMQRAR